MPWGHAWGIRAESVDIARVRDLQVDPPETRIDLSTLRTATVVGVAMRAVTT